MQRLTNKTRTQLPTELPIDLKTARQIIREGYSSPDADDELSDIIRMATIWLEDLRGLTVLRTSWALDFCEWPLGDILPLPMPPLVSVEKVEYYDEDDALAELPATDYRVIPWVSSHRRRGLIQLLAEGWPKISPRPDAIKISLTAGPETPAEIDPIVRSVLGKLVTQDYGPGRDGVIIGPAPQEMPHSLRSMLAIVGPTLTAGLV